LKELAQIWTFLGNKLSIFPNFYKLERFYELICSLNCGFFCFYLIYFSDKINSKIQSVRQVIVLDFIALSNWMSSIGFWGTTIQLASLHRTDMLLDLAYSAFCIGFGGGVECTGHRLRQGAQSLQNRMWAQQSKRTRSFELGVGLLHMWHTLGSKVFT